VFVTCDAITNKYENPLYNGVNLVYVKVKANGWQSIIHDLIAFLKVVGHVEHIVVLGVSAGVWFPVMRIICDLKGVQLIVNLDGIEWRRSKFSLAARCVLKGFTYFAQKFAHCVVIDNEALRSYLGMETRAKAVCIGYSGDRIGEIGKWDIIKGTALTICRIEPENQLELLFEAALESKIVRKYVVVGNWLHSEYSRRLFQVYKSHSKIELVMATYEPEKIDYLRSTCEFYFHGHSVGGTNPSLVEMLFYDCEIFCFDCVFNRWTAKDSAWYFVDSGDLVDQIELSLLGMRDKIGNRDTLRKNFTASEVVKKYLDVFSSHNCRNR
jgi:hypothetical protein